MPIARLLLVARALTAMMICFALPAWSADADLAVVRIGTAMPLTGSLSAIGNDARQGAQLAIDDFNRQGINIGGKQVRFELVVKDDQANTAVGKAVAEELVAAKVKAVVGHLNSGTTIPAAPIYARAGIALVSPAATNPKLTQLKFNQVFRLITNDDAMGLGLASWIMVQPIRPTVFVVDDGTAYGRGLASNFVLAFTQFGGQLSGRETVAERAMEFSALVDKIRNAGPQWLFFAGMDHQAGPLLKQLRAADVKLRMIGSDGICSLEMVQAAGGGGVWGDIVCAEPGGIEREFSGEFLRFKERFAQTFGKPMEIYAPNAYDSVAVIVQAMVEAGSTEPKDFLPKLRTIRYNGLIGPIAFDANGELQNGSLTLYTFRAGKRVRFSRANVPRQQ